VSKGDAQKDVSAIIEDLAERARAESICSINHAVNAKAVALSNDEVKAVIRELLDRDYQLIAIEPLRGFGSSLMSYPLQFSFRAGANSGPIALDESFVVLVELPVQAVKRISRSPESARVSDVPFVIAASARAQAARVPFMDASQRAAREVSFFQSIGLGAWRPGASGTDETATAVIKYTDTMSTVDTTAWSPGQIVDDTYPDNGPDDHDDSVTGWKADHGDDDSSPIYPEPGDGSWSPRPPPGGWPGGPPGRPGGGWPWPDPPSPYWRRRRE
jgi:hypothetical protein